MDELHHAAAEVLADLPPETRTLLLDGAQDELAAAARLATHAREAARVSAQLAAAGAQEPDPGDDPAARVLALLPPATRAALAREAPPLPATWSEWDPFPESFSARAQKRRGGVYTERPLVELLLDLCELRGDERVLEPAAGGGAFLLRAWERSGPRTELVGVDLHPFACRAARARAALCALERGLPGAAAPRVEQGDALLATKGAAAERDSFDLVLGNPPWVRGERIPAAARARYRERRGDLGPGNTDLSCYFVAAALEWLREGGRLAFVLSQGLLEARSTRGLRALLARHRIEAVVGLEWAEGLFPEASVIPCLLVVRKGAPPRDHRVRLGSGRWTAERTGLEVEWTSVLQARWLELAVEERWPLALSRGDERVLRALRAAPTPLEAGYGLAVRTRDSARRLIADGASPPADFADPRPLRDGREVSAFGLAPVSRWIDWQPERISDPKPAGFFAGPKLLVARIALVPEAAVDDGDALCRNTVMVCRAPGLCLHAVAAALNSLPLRHYAFHLLRAGVLAGSHRCTLYAGVIQAFPLPPALLDDPGYAAALSALGREAERLTQAGAADELGGLQRELDAHVAAGFGLDATALAHLRRAASREPLARVLRPRPLGGKRRRIGVQEFAAGARYR
ncbi:MAG: N-6 DNA methylase [Planctomycetota bacterium]